MDMATDMDMRRRSDCGGGLGVNIFDLGRRSNELNELTNFGDALGRMMNCAASALKGQPVPSPGQRPGYQGIKPFAL